jgi:hypothetical protein
LQGSKFPCQLRKLEKRSRNAMAEKHKLQRASQGRAIMIFVIAKSESQVVGTIVSGREVPSRLFSGGFDVSIARAEERIDNGARTRTWSSSTSSTI